MHLRGKLRQSNVGDKQRTVTRNRVAPQFMAASSRWCYRPAVELKNECQTTVKECNMLHIIKQKHIGRLVILPKYGQIRIGTCKTTSLCRTLFFMENKERNWIMKEKLQLGRGQASSKHARNKSFSPSCTSLFFLIKKKKNYSYSVSSSTITCLSIANQSRAVNPNRQSSKVASQKTQTSR